MPYLVVTTNGQCVRVFIVSYADAVSAGLNARLVSIAIATED